MVREEGSVYRHSQQLPRSLPARDAVLTRGVAGRPAHPPPPHAPAAPSSSCPSPARLLKHDYAALAPGRRARSREGHHEERTEAHDTGEIDCKVEELEVPMGTVRLVPASSTFRAPIWTCAHTPRRDLRSSTLASPCPIMRTRGAHHHRRVLLGLCPPNTRRRRHRDRSEFMKIMLSFASHLY